MADRRRTFGPVVVTGVGATILTAVAGTQQWRGVDSREPGIEILTTGSGASQMPLATTLAMVVLAAWGVVLVARGRWRSAVAVLAAVASVGLLAVVVSGWWLVPRSLRSSLADLGVADGGIDVRAWYWIALVAALLSAVAGVLAAVLVRSWPEMGTRYDAPGGGQPTPGQEPEAPSSLDLWKALDRGRDPTD